MNATPDVLAMHADAQPDKPKLDFTGQYERVVASGAGTAAPDFVFRVNQAGDHLECLVREIAVPGGNKNHRAFRLHGDMEADGSVNLFRRNDPSFLARLIPGRTPATPVLEFAGSKHPLVRVAPTATMLNVPDHVDALVKRVCDKSQSEEIELNYMPRIGALIVRARSRVLRLLISQPEVEMASANQLAGDAEL